MSQKNSTSDLSFNVAGLRFNPKKSKKNSETKLTSNLNNSSEKINDIISPTDTISSKQKVQSPFIESPQQIYNIPETSKALEKELLEKKEEIKTLKKNYKEKVALIETENKKNIEKIEEKYKEMMVKLNENCNKTINEVKAIYNQNISKINQQYLEILNEIRTLRTNTIPLSVHYDKINEINLNWEKKLKKLQEDYDNKFKQIYSKVNDTIPLDSIKLTNAQQDLITTLSNIKLKHKIGYYSYISELQNKYDELYRQINFGKNEKLENFKNATIKKFNQLLGITTSDINTNMNTNSTKNENNIINNLNNTNNLNINEYRKKSEIVNYDTSKLNKLNNSIKRGNAFDGETYTNNNGTVSKIQDKFSSDFESFNFNEDSIPNRDIQALSPPELIK